MLSLSLLLHDSGGPYTSRTREHATDVYAPRRPGRMRAPRCSLGRGQREDMRKQDCGLWYGHVAQRTKTQGAKQNEALNLERRGCAYSECWRMLANCDERLCQWQGGARKREIRPDGICCGQKTCLKSQIIIGPTCRSRTASTAPATADRRGMRVRSEGTDIAAARWRGRRRRARNRARAFALALALPAAPEVFVRGPARARDRSRCEDSQRPHARA